MKTNKFKFITILLVVVTLGVIAACEKQNEITSINVETATIIGQMRQRDMMKWAEEKRLQQLQDESDKAYNERVAKMYDKYWESLRAYKKSKHQIVYGWFGGWSATEGIKKSFLTNLPDSVDVVSIWGGTTEFDESDPRWADLKYAQEVKGLRVLLCWQTGSSGLGLPGGVAEFNKRHADKNDVEKAKAYAEELTQFIKKHNLNGYDIDWEPNVGDHHGCGNLYQACDGSSSDSSAPAKAFIEEMGKNFGPKQTTDYNPRNTGTLLFFDGELNDMGDRFPEYGDYFDYYLEQNYFSKYTIPSYSVTLIKGFDKSKYIMCDEFEKGPSTAGVCGAQGNKVCAEVKAENVVYYQYGGWAAYHIELEEMYDYRAVKKVIQIMNPSDVYNP